MPEFSTRGWNWGTATVKPREGTTPGSLSIQCDATSKTAPDQDGKLLMKLPVDKMAQCVFSKGRTEYEGGDLMVQLEAPEVMPQSGVVLSDMRIYIPKDAKVGGVEAREDQEYTETVREKLQECIEQSRQKAGDVVGTMPDISMLSPRGTYSLQLFAERMRMYGTATKQSKQVLQWFIKYEDITGVYLLDDSRYGRDGCKWMVIGLRAAIKAGPSTVAAIVMELSDDQIEADEPMRFEVSDQQIQESKNKAGDPMIERAMSGPVCEVIPKALRGLTKAKIFGPSKNYSSAEDTKCFKAVLKTGAKEGFLYQLEKGFLFAPNPVTFVRHEQLDTIEFIDVHEKSMFIGIDFRLKNGVQHSFTGMLRKELRPLLNFIQGKQGVGGSLSQVTVKGADKEDDPESDQDDDDDPVTDDGGEDEESEAESEGGSDESYADADEDSDESRKRKRKEKKEKKSGSKMAKKEKKSKKHKKDKKSKKEKKKDKKEKKMKLDKGSQGSQEVKDE